LVQSGFSPNPEELQWTLTKRRALFFQAIVLFRKAQIAVDVSREKGLAPDFSSVSCTILAMARLRPFQGPVRTDRSVVGAAMSWIDRNHMLRREIFVQGFRISMNHARAFIARTSNPHHFLNLGSTITWHISGDICFSDQPHEGSAGHSG